MEYAYTPEGWLSAITKADGTVLTFAYDKTGNLLTQNTGENQNIESSYNEIGQVTTVTSPEGTITYQYNQQGYLVSVTNGNGDVVSYTYDQYGNKLSMTYPDGRVVSYTYDSMNRMTSVTGLDGEVTTYAYDAAGRRVETASRNLTTEYKYDVVGSLVEQTTTGSSNLSFQYGYNLNGYITGEVRTENGETITSAYAYDPLGELISFTQSNGYGEQYTYDKAGNMTQKVITPLGSVPNEKGTVENAVILKMKYNQGNQLVSMANGGDKITYKYDKNGSMVEKALTSKQYGALTDTYAYNSLDQLVSYAGYDGYQQQFAYDANGMRLSKSEYGNGNRSTLEELLRGEIAGLPEAVVPVVVSEDEAAVPAEYEWATTEYLYDITQEYYQVIQQTTTSGNTTATTAYAYGLERIAAYDANNTTQYIYDGRGSVAQTISAPVAGASISAALPQVEVQSYAYTAFGEQMGVKVSGFGYNAEDFDAATGMINLRMRQYEPTLNRFSQKDIIRSSGLISIDYNRFVYVVNNPVLYCDPSGTTAISSYAVRSINETAKKLAQDALNANPKEQMSAAKKAYDYMKKNYNYLYGINKQKFHEIEALRKAAKKSIDSREFPDNKDILDYGFGLLLCMAIVGNEIPLTSNNQTTQGNGIGSANHDLLHFILTNAYNEDKYYESGNCARYIYEILEYAGFDWDPNKQQIKGALSQYEYLSQDLGLTTEVIKESNGEGGGFRLYPAIKLFDLIYLDVYPTSRTQHVMIVVGFDDDGNPLLAGNTNDKISMPLQDVIDSAEDVYVVHTNIYIDNSIKE
ncbi:MAG: hypothetical protein IKC28_01690 [Clostridia bacterium]|nr:hypothetical protein [Clostridia bacterium]